MNNINTYPKGWKGPRPSEMALAIAKAERVAFLKIETRLYGKRNKLWFEGLFPIKPEKPKEQS